ncbi:hypothetical protein WN51_09346 [Melipona quadrifasciata]|uniref:Uncharacterized protein n=1 Tax=Melipona quadrifasciata TaxID=166423 RepID=A0A0N0BIF7_9HYME|nr:hypothetical protein WN51_09346 [Melipona quadrifasciata]
MAMFVKFEKQRHPLWVSLMQRRVVDASIVWNYALVTALQRNAVTPRTRRRTKVATSRLSRDLLRKDWPVISSARKFAALAQSGVQVKRWPMIGRMSLIKYHVGSNAGYSLPGVCNLSQYGPFEMANRAIINSSTRRKKTNRSGILLNALEVSTADWYYESYCEDVANRPHVMSRSPFGNNPVHSSVPVTSRYLRTDHRQSPSYLRSPRSKYVLSAKAGIVLTQRSVSQEEGPEESSAKESDSKLSIRSFPAEDNVRKLRPRRGTSRECCNLYVTTAKVAKREFTTIRKGTPWLSPLPVQQENAPDKFTDGAV